MGVCSVALSAQLSWQVGAFTTVACKGWESALAALPCSAWMGQVAWCSGGGGLVVFVSMHHSSRMNSGLRVILWDALRKGCAPCCAVVSVLVFLQMTIETAGQRSPCLCCQRRGVVGDLPAQLHGWSLFYSPDENFLGFLLCWGSDMQIPGFRAWFWCWVYVTAELNAIIFFPPPWKIFAVCICKEESCCKGLLFVSVHLERCLQLKIMLCKAFRRGLFSPLWIYLLLDFPFVCLTSYCVPFT